MVDVPITIACGNYDRTRAIRDGTVKVEGCAVTYLPLYPEEIFHRAFKFQEFDVSEISFSSYIRTVATGTSAYIGVPAFVSRIFRHSGIYIRNGAGIEKPEDLRGKRIGVPEYQITAVVWMRGMMQHEYGVTPVGDPLAQRRPGAAGPRTSARRSSRSRASISSRSATTRRWSACSGTASSTRCSRRGRRRRSSTASRTSRGCFPTRARRSRPTTKRRGCSRSCISSASAKRSPKNIRGWRPASTRRSAKPRRWR